MPELGKKWKIKAKNGREMRISGVVWANRSIQGGYGNFRKNERIPKIIPPAPFLCVGLGDLGDFGRKILGFCLWSARCGAVGHSPETCRYSCWHRRNLAKGVDTIQDSICPGIPPCRAEIRRNFVFAPPRPLLNARPLGTTRTTSAFQLAASAVSMRVLDQHACRFNLRTVPWSALRPDRYRGFLRASVRHHRSLFNFERNVGSVSTVYQTSRQNVIFEAFELRTW